MFDQEEAGFVVLDLHKFDVVSHGRIHPYLTDICLVPSSCLFSSVISLNVQILSLMQYLTYLTDNENLTI